MNEGLLPLIIYSPVNFHVAEAKFYISIATPSTGVDPGKFRRGGGTLFQEKSICVWVPTHSQIPRTSAKQGTPISAKGSHRGCPLINPSILNEQD